MTDAKPYTPPKVWKFEQNKGGVFAAINRPISGATHKTKLPIGKHPLQLYSFATPNGIKITIMLEELLALGYRGAEYDAHLIKIGQGDQFGSGFVEINPNSKIPSLNDLSSNKPIHLFESGSILLYLADKFEALIPMDIGERTQCLNWLFWQMGNAPYLGGGFGHFYVYAPEKIKYCIDRFSMEVKRQLDVLDRHLESHKYMCGDTYTIADIAIWPWYGALVLNRVYEACEFLDTQSYVHVNRWAKEIGEREAVKRGSIVNKTWGEPIEQLHERHDASDFETKTQDHLKVVVLNQKN